MQRITGSTPARVRFDEYKTRSPATVYDDRLDMPKVRPQPHVHPQPGPLDARGNCPGCAVYEPTHPHPEDGIHAGLARDCPVCAEESR